jgi:hypothetical protein
MTHGYMSFVKIVINDTNHAQQLGWGFGVYRGTATGDDARFTHTPNGPITLCTFSATIARPYCVVIVVASLLSFSASHSDVQHSLQRPNIHESV